VTDSTRFVAAILSAWLAAACGSLQEAPLQFDLEAKMFTPPPGAARIYVYRLGKTRVLGVDSVIFIEPGSAGGYGQVGRIGSNVYRFIDVPPGRHTITALTLKPNGGSDSQLAANSLTVDAVEGSSHFVSVKVPAFWINHPPEMRLVSAAEGAAAVRSRKLAGS
jgi:hypothetical protein